MKVNFIYKKITSLILVLSFIVPTLFFTAPNKAQALVAADVIGGPSNVVNVGFSAVSASSDVISATAQSSLTFKEYVLDPLTVLLREVLIQSITASIVNWINRGFDGEPAFVTDLQGFMLDVGDQVVGRYIQGSKLAGLCSPFKLDVRIALALDYYAKDNVSCTLTGVLGNVNDAIIDFSSENAWNQWYELSINPNNNAFGSFLSARQALRQDVASAQSIESQKLGWGSGIKSFEVCDKKTKRAKPWVNPDKPRNPSAKIWVNPDKPRNPSAKPQINPNRPRNPSAGTGAGPKNAANISVGKSNCKILTPGVIINKQLSKTLGSGFKQLELADEINEIVGALLGQLSKQVFGGSRGGLLGLSRSSYGRPSYVNQLVKESETRALEKFQGFGGDIVVKAIKIERKYITTKTVSEERLNTSEIMLSSLKQCYIDKLSTSQTPPLTIEQQTTATNEIKSATSTVAISITPLKTSIKNNITQAKNNISQLIIIRKNLLKAKSRVNVERIISNQLNPLIKSRGVHNQSDFFIAEQQRKDIKDITEAIDKATNTKLVICKSFPVNQNSGTN